MSTEFNIDYAKDAGPVIDLVDIPAFLLATTKNFDVTSVSERSAERNISRFLASAVDLKFPGSGGKLA